MGKGAVIGLCSVLFVALIVAIAIGVHKGNDGKVVTSNKSVNFVCQQTDYKDTCIKSLSGHDEADPRELIKAEFKAAIENVQDVIKSSDLIEEAEKDKRTSQAVETCKELLGTSIEDLQRSLDRLGTFDVRKIDSFLLDLETWLSGSITYQETCLDGFEETSGETGEKMKKLLNVTGELTSNVLAMVTQINKMLDDFEIPLLNRKLLESSEEPSWMDAGRRSLLQASPRPNVVVALDGSGNFRSINDAIKSVPAKNIRAYIILVKPGVYREYVDVPRHINGVVLLGSGADKTIITGDKSYAKGVGTFKTATFGT
jgi:pectinesterase